MVIKIFKDICFMSIWTLVLFNNNVRSLLCARRPNSSAAVAGCRGC